MSHSDTTIDLGRPVSGDVIDLILDDHRRFEHLFRMVRDSSSHRDGVRRAFAALHVAHPLAEEELVYPVLRRRDAIGEHEAEHGEEEHAEGHEALLAVLELKGTDTQAFDDALEELARVVSTTWSRRSSASSTRRARRWPSAPATSSARSSPRPAIATWTRGAAPSPTSAASWRRPDGTARWRSDRRVTSRAAPR